MKGSDSPLGNPQKVGGRALGCGAQGKGGQGDRDHQHLSLSCLCFLPT